MSGECATKKESRIVTTFNQVKATAERVQRLAVNLSSRTLPVAQQLPPSGKDTAEEKVSAACFVIVELETLDSVLREAGNILSSILERLEI
jgi:hypothetical protein